MLKQFKINAVNPVVNSETGNVAYAITVNYEGKELTIWRTEAQFKTDMQRSNVEVDWTNPNFRSLINGQVQGEIIKVKAGDKYTVEVSNPDGTTGTEEREYSQDGLQVTDGFLSFEPSLNAQIAAAVAEKMANISF